ncbi:ABC-2 type transport system permease protein [Epilithonimonas bovis DSM 19482]|uniref:ABC-2 type transport system permease protein n=1 Tax=Epilithonimonas bovis DSM 19482 TaxID=1121284 RepID=A0A1U7PW13_9FLAO|nr:DUF3526 domain-containing protein [Epilithonimonas bovis]SIT97745.1 ABC-2 type transport system permease protein [Epilithonimonas bovis DSM 19482]
MTSYIFKQFFRNRGYLSALVFLLIAGIMAIYTGKNFLDRNQDIIEKSRLFQQESIDKNVTYHKDDLGLILYYVKFNWINETPQLAALSIGMRDLNPSIQGVTIRNLEEQRYNSDFYNPANAAAGNFDFSFVLVFIFPLIIVAFCYNLISEEEESGRWKLLSVQCRSLARFIDCKFLVRVLAISIIYLLLIAIATIWIDIPMDKNFLYFILSGWLYLLFWFALCRFVISFRKSSAYNALILLTVWIGLNFIIPMGSNMAIQKIFPVKEGLKAVMEQREGYHNKWYEAKLPTMEKFYKAYPQFKQFKINESDSFSWTWYYAMQHMGDLEAAASSEQYIAKMQKRNQAAVVLGYFFPNIHTQLTENDLAQSGMENHLAFGSALKKFHEKKRLFFYPLIFSGKDADSVNWKLQIREVFRQPTKINSVALFLPYVFIIILFILLSQNNIRKL